MLGPALATLAAPVQALHAAPLPCRYAGLARIERGRHWLVPLLAALARLPERGAAVPTEVAFSVHGQGERWARRFGPWPMVSRLWAQDGHLCEQLGAVRFAFDLQAREGGIDWSVRRVRAFGLIPLPARWFGGVRCREAWQGERYTFLVDVTLPWVGALIRYEGWLEPQ
ncbi:hypothetical protein A9K58_13535 [Stenotrophomonas maltophilia]|uniref:DUF4166 domain-containing protein n=1 Tax=Stenotrophomonas maltophilia TaxID=40324 RepID=A0A1A6XSQ1_STEMA|nr:DUF4166 domain-containing protein [Stenotrophomonas maltophilia]OBU65614.1 hypothetical protein A9K58_13535 [Stenotrophomonas maltophilia]